MSCGWGERQRPYWCQLESHVVSKNYCYPVRPPVHREACHPADCPQWHATPWGQVLLSKKLPPKFSFIYLYKIPTSSRKIYISLSSLSLSLSLILLYPKLQRDFSLYFHSLPDVSLRSGFFRVFLCLIAFRLVHFIAGCMSIQPTSACLTPRIVL